MYRSLCTAGFAEHMVGPLNHFAHPRPPPHHPPAIRWGIMAGCSFTILFSLAKHLCRYKKRQQKRQQWQEKAGIVSQLSQLSADADTIPNPLLHGPLALAVHDTDVISTSEPGLIQNVPWSDWQIDQHDIRICQRPDGRLWELGSGASAKVTQCHQYLIGVISTFPAMCIIGFGCQSCIDVSPMAMAFPFLMCTEP